MIMENRVARYIDSEHLLDADGLHLVALSGGADSVALLLVLLRLGYRVEAAHCNFRLRGEESDRDEQFVRQLCQEYGVPLHLAHFDTQEYASLHHVSIEMAARDLRYKYFEQLRADIGAADICVAHHQDDAVETVLMNLVRGTGIHGLTGIRQRNGNIVRPLLCVSRSEIEEFLKAEGQTYVTDSTNLVADVLRNKLRLKVIPMLNDLWPGASEAIARTARNMAEAEKVYNDAIDRLAADIITTEGDVLSIAADSLLASPSPKSILHEQLSTRGFTSAQCEQMLDCIAEGRVGRQFLSDSAQVVADRGRLLIAPLPKELPPMRIPETGTYVYAGKRKFSVSVTSDLTVSRKPMSATLDASLVPFPLTIRPIAPSDRFHPFGMRGQKLVSDFLTDNKVSLVDRQRQLVVADRDGRIVWLVGLRTDQRAAVSSSTRSVLRLEAL